MSIAKALALAGLLSAVACGAASRRGQGEPTDSSAGVAGGIGAGGAAGVGGGPAGAHCELPPAALVRLSFPQVVAAVGDLLTAELASELSTVVELDSRATPMMPLGDEGSVIHDAIFSKSDDLAQRAGRYVAEHFELTGCAGSDYGCVSQYISDLAERAFRRPLSEQEREALWLTGRRAEALGAAAPVAAEYGVYAVFASPHFLYRSELGSGEDTAAGDERPLGDYELASSLAYLLSDRGPDQALLDAAGAGKLAADTGIREQVTRLLEQPAIRQHVEALLASYLGVPRIETVVIDPWLYPKFSPSLRNAMRDEVEQLLAATLWTEPVAALLSTRTATVNAPLAELYGVTFPPPGQQLSSDGFAQVQLPERRAGLLTRAGVLLPRSRPDGPSLVARGIFVAQTLLCRDVTPPPLEAPPLSDPSVPEGERERALYRMGTEPCLSCHADTDPFGLALEELDAIGQFRDEYPNGTVVDASATLPAYLDHREVRGALALSRALPAELLAACLGQRFLERGVAIAEGQPDPTCQRQELARRWQDEPDVSLADVVEQVALSRSFRWRRR